MFKTIKDEEYRRFVQPYEDALNNIKNRIDILNQDYRRHFKNYAIHNTQWRIKKLSSTIDKLKRKKAPITIDSVKNNINDIAGLRVICYFTEDVYAVVNFVKNLPDITVIEEDDYIKEPKDNGYKSYHIVIGIPIYYIDGKQIYPVELQIRTMAMDFWASMDHRIAYKNNTVDPKIEKKMFQYAKLLDDIERKMTEFCEE